MGVQKNYSTINNDSVTPTSSITSSPPQRLKHSREDSQSRLLPNPVNTPPDSPTSTGPFLIPQCLQSITSSGFFLIALAQICFALMNFMAKLLQNDPSGPIVPTWELITIRMGITGLGCIIYNYASKTHNPLTGPKGVRLLLILRGVAGFFGLFGTYYSVRYLSLSDSISLTFLAPVGTGILAALILNEKYTISEAVCAVVSLGGVVLIAKPEFIFPDRDDEPITGPDGTPITPEQRTVAVFVALVGVLGASFSYMAIRKIGTRATAGHSIVYFSLYSVIVSLLIPVVLPDVKPVLPTDLKFVILFILMGVFGLIAQILLTYGLQREKAGRGSLALYIQLPIAMSLDAIFFSDQMPDNLSILGALIIVGSALSTAFLGASRKKIIQQNKAVSGDEESGPLSRN